MAALVLIKVKEMIIIATINNSIIMQRIIYY